MSPLIPQHREGGEGAGAGRFAPAVRSPLSKTAYDGGGPIVNGGGANRSSGSKPAWDGGRVCDLEPLARELPAFLARAVGLSGSLRALAACQAVSRAWRDALGFGEERGKELFGGIVRSSGVPASLRPAVWQMLVQRAVAGGGGRGGDGDKDRRVSSGSSIAGGGGGGGGSIGGRESFSSCSFSSSLSSFAQLVEIGRAGPHAALIARDVPRAFGAVAPHKRRESGDGRRSETTPGNSSSIRRGLASATATPRSTAAATSTPRQGGRRRMTMGGAGGGGGGGGEDRGGGGGGGDGLGFFGGALTNLLVGNWRLDDDELVGARGTGTPPRRRGWGTTPHRRRASLQGENGGGGFNDTGGGGGGPFSWLNPGVSPGTGPGARVAAGGASPSREPAGGGFTLASFPLSPFRRDDDGGGGRGATRRLPPHSPPPSAPDPSSEGVGAGIRTSPPRSSRRMPIGGGSGGGDGSSGGGLTPRQQTEKTAGRRGWSPTVVPVIGGNAAAAAAAASGGQQTAGAAGTTTPARQEAGVETAVVAEDNSAVLERFDDAWAAVPVGSKRRCLENVLLAIAARFRAVGYCQVRGLGCEALTKPGRQGHGAETGAFFFYWNGRERCPCVISFLSAHGKVSVQAANRRACVPRITLLRLSCLPLRHGPL